MTRFYKFGLICCLIALASAGCAVKNSAEIKNTRAAQVATSSAFNIDDEAAPAQPFVGTFSPSLPPKATTTKTSTKIASKSTASTTAAAIPATPPQIPAECGQNYDCFVTYYKSLVKNYGLDVTFAMIKDQYNTNSYVNSNCHALMHIVGQAATDIYPNVTDAFAHGDQFCASGYYHGVMEAIVAKMGRDEVPLKLNTMCADIPGKNRYSLDYFNCVHGLGHGLMEFTNNELFDSLALCDKLTGEWEESSCYGGVFMENVITDFRDHFTKYLHPDDPMYPCPDVGHQYKEACYLIQSSYVLKLANGDFSKVVTACANVEQEFQPTCFQSMGRDASGWSVSNVQATKKTCSLTANYFQESNCIIGAVKDFVWHFHSEEKGDELCDALDTDLQSVCLSTAKSYYATF